MILFRHANVRATRECYFPICRGAILLTSLLLAGPATAFGQNATAAKQDAVAAKADAKTDTRTPTFENVSYGPHERNVFDLWLAKSDKPTPLLIFIHGGGFVTGDKRWARNNPAVAQCLASGVSFASLNYRFREHANIQEILRDAARAVQTIRSRAKEWNIDPDRIASFGSSAGAGTSLWLAFHDDLADPQATDPVLRQSSRLAAAGSLDGQFSYDFREWRDFLGPCEFERPTSEWLSFYGFQSDEQSKTDAADKVMKDCSMIGLIGKDDPPVAVASAMGDGKFINQSHYVHHPKHSSLIAERCKEKGVECLLVLSDDEGKRDQMKQREKVVQFLIEKLKSEPAAKK
ncbi:MAG TPA: alpha/beta hydrolase [Pirellulales bacterium]|jgi:acetyl esterase/lipase